MLTFRQQLLIAAICQSSVLSIINTVCKARHHQVVHEVMLYIRVPGIIQSKPQLPAHSPSSIRLVVWRKSPA